MAEVEVKVDMGHLLKKLRKLPEKVRKNVIVGAVRAGAKPIVEEAKKNAPVRTGALRDSIGVKKMRTRDKNIVLFTISPMRKSIAKHFRANGVRWSIKGEVDPYYAHFVEFGTKKMAAHPFMRPAYENKGEEAIDAAREYMRKRIDKELKKL